MDNFSRDSSRDATNAQPLRYPLNRVVSSLDPSELESAVSDLDAAGLAADRIEVITPDDVAHIESPIDQPGLQGLLARLILSFGGDLSFLEAARRALAAGRVLVMVAVEEEDEKSRVANILESHGADAAVFVGPWSFERLA